MDDDARFTIDAIRPLVSHENPTGQHLVVTFTCPASGTHVNARWTAPQSSGIAAEVASRAKQTAWYEVRRQVHSALYAALGGSALGRIAATVVDSAFVGAAVSSPGAPVAAVPRDPAVIAAFRSVVSEFVWVGGRWVHKSAAASMMSPFDRQLHEHPLSSAYDRSVGARIALEISAAHGGISDIERSELEALLDPTIGSLDSLQNRPPLSRAELAEVSAGPVRVTLLALGWMIALCDEAFDSAEDHRLGGIADGLAVAPADRIRARDLARAWMLDQWFERAFAWGGHDSHLRDQAIAVGERIGMSRDEVETAEARFQKRRAG